MKCVICGESTLDESVVEHIQHIKTRKENITKELSRFDSSDSELSQKLSQKLNKYDIEINQLENSFSSIKRLCPKCEEMIESIIEDKLYDMRDEIIEELRGVLK
jgi:prefoldin subunit 5